jgi:hypothetical protein
VDKHLIGAVELDFRCQDLVGTTVLPIASGRQNEESESAVAASQNRAKYHGCHWRETTASYSTYRFHWHACAFLVCLLLPFGQKISKTAALRLRASLETSLSKAILGQTIKMTIQLTRSPPSRFPFPSSSSQPRCHQIRAFPSPSPTHFFIFHRAPT